MGSPEVDIIVPVWNRPSETRNCLVSIIGDNPHARLILVDNGSDRETERLLQEFAEALDHRALLLRNEVNQGAVKAVNRGLSRAEADHVVIVRNTSLVTKGWLEPMVQLARENAEAGLIIPRLVSSPGGKAKGSPAGPSARQEEDHGSLAAMLLKKRLYDDIGGFDEELDGGLWCLKDYSRRAYRKGLLTFSVAAGTVYYTDETPLGSLSRREETLRRSQDAYRQRWGEAGAFCIHLPRETDGNMLRQRVDILLEGARQGHRFTLLLHPKLHKGAVAAGFDRFHGNLDIVRLPLLFPDRAGWRQLAQLKDTTPDIRAVAGIEGMPFPGVEESMPFARLEEMVVDARERFYGQ
jgi:GT2 family glycosyltransferase